MYLSLPSLRTIYPKGYICVHFLWNGRLGILFRRTNVSVPCYTGTTVKRYKKPVGMLIGICSSFWKKKYFIRQARLERLATVDVVFLISGSPFTRCCLKSKRPTYEHSLYQKVDPNLYCMDTCNQYLHLLCRLVRPKSLFIYGSNIYKYVDARQRELYNVP